MSEDMKSRPETNLGDGVNTSWWPGEGTKSSTMRQYTGGRKVETHHASHPRQPFQMPLRLSCQEYVHQGRRRVFRKRHGRHLLTLWPRVRVTPPSWVFSVHSDRIAYTHSWSSGIRCTGGQLQWQTPGWEPVLVGPQEVFVLTKASTHLSSPYGSSVKQTALSREWRCRKRNMIQKKE